MRRFGLIYCFVFVFVLACTPGNGSDPYGDGLTPVGDYGIEPTPGGKTDTGYLSDLATEIEGLFYATVIVDGREMSEEARAYYTEGLMKENSRALQALADPQIKYAKNQLNSFKLHLNLTSSSVTGLKSEITEDGYIHVDYQASVESIITKIDLDELGISMAELLQKSFQAIVPDDTSRMSTDVGVACLQQGHPSHDYYYFYYFDPNQEGCAEAMEKAGIGRITAELKIHDLAPTKTVYPEYDLLKADGRIDIVVFFGAADHDWVPGKWDWGIHSYNGFARDIRSLGFEEKEHAPGQRFERTVGDRVESIIMIGPETLKLLNEDSNGIFKELVKKSEIIFYNGHSFYGSLDVLRDESIYPGSYQIFFMNSCWSYEYYTKQVFRANERPDDPKGWLLADVLNDTESGWFHNMTRESTILLNNLLLGIEHDGIDGDKFYTWDRIIAAMNKYAIEAQIDHRSETHEIYGVSGVRTNRFDPEAVESDDTALGAPF